MFIHELNDIYTKKFKANLHASFFNRSVPAHMWLKNKNEQDKRRYRRIIFFGIKYFYAF